MYRYFLDIEPMMKDFIGIIPILDILKYLEKNLNNLLGVHYGEHIQFLGDNGYIQDNTGKQKFRVYTNLAMTIQQMKFIYDCLFYETHPFREYVDGSVYKHNTL